MTLPPYDPGADAASNGSRVQAVRACTLHRTVGTWPGDRSVGKNRRHSSPGTFNFLVGQGRDEWLMFYPADVRCSHAAGSNRAGPGIEFSGQNGAPLTDWQIVAGGEIIRTLADLYDIPLVLYDGPRTPIDGSSFRGFVNHLSVATEPQWRHVNYVTQDEFARMSGGTPTEEDDMKSIFVQSKKGGFIYLLNPDGTVTPVKSRENGQVLMFFKLVDGDVDAPAQLDDAVVKGFPLYGDVLPRGWPNPEKVPATQGGTG